MGTPVTYQILQSGQLQVGVQFIGANSVGPQLTMTLPRVLITPAASLNMIHDEWGQLTLDGEVLVDITTGSFGTIVHPDSGATSPLPDEYYIGKGIVSIQQATDTSYIDVGNVPQFEFTPEVKKLDHYSSRLGIKTKDKTVVQEKAAKLKIVLDEWTARNLQMMLMGV
jgi:hypothetical protein